MQLVRSDSSGKVLQHAEDQRLVEAIRAGNPRAAAPLYDLLMPSIEATLYRVLRQRAPEFEDLTQTTYERVIRAIAHGNFEGRSQLKTWASAIAAHVAVDHLRRNSCEQQVFERLDGSSVAPFAHNMVPERQLEARSELRKVQGVLRRMKPRRATVLVMHDVFGYGVPQVAKRIGLTTAAVQSTLQRAREEFVRRCACTTHPPQEHR
jgi:RNA polymerase sigma-70 factor (ECF subfamily)